jgi:hypothetical protein
MKIFEKVTETKEIEKLKSILCDICGNSQKNWILEKSDYNEMIENEVIIKHNKSKSYCGEGSVQWLEPDICPNCFTDKILPYMKKISYAPDKLEYSETWF